MSEFTVPVVQIQKVGKHPNADALSIATVDGCPAIFRTGDFQPGDVAVYIPVDAIVDSRLEWVKRDLTFLKFKKDGTHRVKASKLRGIFSMGILIKVPKELEVVPELGADVHEILGILKYEEPEPTFMNTGNEHDPGYMNVYTDIESWRKYKHVFVAGEEVVITEKIHGCNSRFVYRDGRIWVGSHKTIKKEDERNLWWRVVAQEGLGEKLAQVPGMVLYGEVYGQVQDLKYGAGPGQVMFRAFDIFDPGHGRYLDYDDFVAVCSRLGIATVPVLYRGSLDFATVEALAVGTSTLANHMREGWVIKALKERWNPEIQRTVLKLVGEDYLLRKEGTELH